MVDIRALTTDERSRIWAEMTREQRKVYEDSISYRLTDRVLNQVYHGAASWRLFAVNIDYEWDLRKAGGRWGQPLRCICGRRVRYQFELESVDHPHMHVKLGSTHFAEHLGIPVKVALEVRKHVNEIQSLMDEILIRYRAGERFPAQYKDAVDHGLLDRDDETFRQHMLDYRRVDLPITTVAHARLRRLVMSSKPGQPKRIEWGQQWTATAHDMMTAYKPHKKNKKRKKKPTAEARYRQEHANPNNKPETAKKDDEFTHIRRLPGLSYQASLEAMERQKKAEQQRKRAATRRAKDLERAEIASRALEILKKSARGEE